MHKKDQVVDVDACHGNFIKSGCCDSKQSTEIGKPMSRGVKVCHVLEGLLQVTVFPWLFLGSNKVCPLPVYTLQRPYEEEVVEDGGDCG